MVFPKIAGLAMLLVPFAGIISDACAEEHTLEQKNRAFSRTTITVSPGDTVYFVNDDDVSHNVISTSRGNEFDLGEQKPGIETPVTFTAPGDVHIRCLIHPRMQATIKVLK